MRRHGQRRLPTATGRQSRRAPGMPTAGNAKTMRDCPGVDHRDRHLPESHSQTSKIQYRCCQTDRTRRDSRPGAEDPARHMPLPSASRNIAEPGRVKRMIDRRQGVGPENCAIRRGDRSGRVEEVQPAPGPEDEAQSTLRETPASRERIAIIPDNIGGFVRLGPGDSAIQIAANSPVRRWPGDDQARQSPAMRLDIEEVVPRSPPDPPNSLISRVDQRRARSRMPVRAPSPERRRYRDPARPPCRAAIRPHHDPAPVPVAYAMAIGHHDARYQYGITYCV